jgi:hypothetical protein
MNWINFVKDHNCNIRFPRIGRSMYNHSSKNYSFTLENWFRETEKTISN